MIWALGDGWAVLLSATVWLLTSVVVGWWAARLPLERVATTGPMTHLHRWERHGAFWQRTLRVRQWKDRLPEAGALFGGASKRTLTSRRTADLEGFRAETIRAERVHWLILASSPIHALWCRPTVFAGMVAFGLAFNVPFIIVQRANRGRLDALLERRKQRTAPTGT